MQTRAPLVALGSLLLAASPALAAETDQDKFEKKLGRFAQQSPDIDLLKPRGLCACTVDDPALERKAGVLTSIILNASDGTSTLILRCTIPIFDTADGTLVSSTDCDRWTLLSR
jgi:hypothetical protein